MRMHLAILLLLGVHLASSQVTNSQPNYTKLTAEQIRHLQNRGFGSTVATPFRASAAYVDRERDEADEDEEDIAPASSQQVRRPLYGDEYLQNAIPVQVRPVQQPKQQQPLYRKPQPQYNQQQQPLYSKSQSKDKSKVEEELEEEEPDRLSLLLPQSKFDCIGKNTGYYADEDLACEVFHYCQDNAKHSWICPDGFTFHQVHLICMPPGGDNICAKSSQYHFVNEYLYKPVNLEEHQRKPNVSLRYSERYYPENYYDSNGYEDDEEQDDEEEKRLVNNQRRPIRIGFQQQIAQQQKQVVSIARPTSALRSAESSSGQVFRSPEEVNISLQQRKPQYVTQRYREELAGY